MEAPSSPKRPGRFIPLSYRFAFFTSLLLLAMLAVLATLLAWHQRETFWRQTEKRGLDIAENLATSSLPNLITYNFLPLEFLVNQTKKAAGLGYVVILDKEGRIAASSDRPDLQGVLAEDETSRLALASPSSLTRTHPGAVPEEDLLEVAVPVLHADSGTRWGTVRVGLSLAPLHGQIRQIILIILAVGVASVLAGTACSVWIARRVTSPLGALALASREMAKGRLLPALDIRTGDEVEALSDSFRQMTGEVMSHRDELERRLEEIRALQEYTEKVLENMPNGVLTVDMGGRVVKLNPTAKTLLGRSGAGPECGLPVLSLLDEGSELRAYMAGVLAHPAEALPCEVRLDMGGTECIVLAGASILHGEEGTPRELIFSFQDMTGYKNLEARLRQTERLAVIGTLAAGMAHEIRNPLSAIKTFVQLLPRKMHKPEYLEKFQRTVPREINRLNKLVDNLLELSRVPRYEFDVIDIRHILRSTLDLLEEEMREKNIRCHLALEDDLPCIWADPTQLVKAFHNLAINAAQAMPEGGELFVRAYLDGQGLSGSTTASADRVRISFRDTGSGMSEEVMRNIFAPFFSNKKGGTGLGLAITHKVVTEHGGRIDVTSEEEKGSEFTISLARHIYRHAGW